MIKDFLWPREICNPKRHLVFNKEEFLKFLNANNGSSSLYTNVYNFSTIDTYCLKYDSAIIDKIYFDIDNYIYENGKKIKVPAYSYILKIHKWCLKNDILHDVRFTGSSYDIIILTHPGSYIKNKKACIFNAQSKLCKKLNVKMDRQVKGDLARIFRITNTFNCKPTARRFCIPLDKDIIYTGEDNIKKIAKNQRFKNNRYGTKFWNIEEYDSNEMVYDDFLPTNFDMKIEDAQLMEDLTESIPPCVRHLLKRQDLCWEERRVVITNLRDNCYLLSECVDILRKYLSDKKFRHCIQEEKQHKYLYRNEKYMFPNQRQIIRLRACPHKEGTYCDKARYGCLLYKRGV